MLEITKLIPSNHCAHRAQITAEMELLFTGLQRHHANGLVTKFVVINQPSFPPRPGLSWRINEHSDQPFLPADQQDILVTLRHPHETWDRLFKLFDHTPPSAFQVSVYQQECEVRFSHSGLVASICHLLDFLKSLEIKKHE